jgi:pentatricopeptide repeat protein
LKSDGKYQGAFYTTTTTTTTTITTSRCFSGGVLSLDQNSEKVEVHNEKSLNASQSERIDLRALASTFFEAKTADDVEKLLKDYPGFSDLLLPCYNTLIRGLGSSRRLDAAFAVVEWLKKNKTLNEIIYNSLLSAVKISKEYGKVGDVIEDMKSQGFQPNIITYNTLMAIYIDQRQPKEVFNIIPQIEVAGLSPTPATYSTILSACKQMGDANGALEFFIKFREKYQKGELQRDCHEEDWKMEFVRVKDLTVRICASSMRKWLEMEENNTGKVLRFVSCMDEAGVEIDQHFFKQMFCACKNKHYTVVRELYKRLRESDMGGDLDVRVYNHIICLMGKAKKWQAALKVYEEMLERGPKPNYLSFVLFLSNFTSLLAATKRRALWRWFLELLDRMHERGLSPTTKKWNAVLSLCSKTGESVASVEIFQRMVRKGVTPTVHTYSMLLNALQKGSLYDEVARVWDHMEKVGVEPNVQAYTILASMYAKKGDHGMVNSVLQQMVQARIEPTVVTFNAIISGCAKSRMAAAAFKWFDKMKGMNVKPNAASYEMVIEALAQGDKPRLAYEIYLQAYHEGLVLNKRIYNVVFKAGQVGGFSVDLHD